MTSCGFKMPIVLECMVASEIKETLAVFTEFTVLNALYIILMKTFI